MGTLNQITEPTVEPVTLTDVKAALRVTHSNDDTRITSLIEGARKFAEEYCRIRIMPQIVELTLDRFPADKFDLGVYPILSVDSVKYDDTSSPKTEVTLVAGTDYNADIISYFGRIRSLGGWPSVSNDYNSVRIRMTVGYATAATSPLLDEVPEGLKEAIRTHVAAMYYCNEAMLRAAKKALIPYRASV